MPRPTGADPLKVIAATLRLDPAADPDWLATKVISDLAGHHLVIARNPKTAAPRRDCKTHPGTETPGGICPSCGPTGD